MEVFAKLVVAKKTPNISKFVPHMYMNMNMNMYKNMNMNDVNDQ